MNHSFDRMTDRNIVEIAKTTKTLHIISDSLHRPRGIFFLSDIILPKEKMTEFVGNERLILNVALVHRVNLKRINLFGVVSFYMHTEMI